MKCISCESISFQIICKNCQKNLLSPSFNKRLLSKDFINYSFYPFKEIEDLILSKYHFHGDRVFKILAKLSFRKFAHNFDLNDEKIIAIPIDDHVRHYFSHTAILAKELKSKNITPKYNILKATNIVKYAGKDLDYRQKNPRKFKVQNIKNQKVILIDDLITTGTTILEAKKALERLNCEVLFSLTLCDAKI